MYLNYSNYLKTNILRGGSHTGASDPWSTRCGGWPASVWRDYYLGANDTWKRTIYDSDSNKYHLLFFDGYHYRNSPQACILEAIINSNQNDFKHPYWKYTTSSKYMNPNLPSGNILPKQYGSYSAILINETASYRSGAPKILGYIVCTLYHDHNDEPYIYMDFVELMNSYEDTEEWPTVKGKQLCAPMLANMMDWLKKYTKIYRFKIWNASDDGIQARKCYLRAGVMNDCSDFWGGPGGEGGWVQERPIKMDRDGNISYIYPRIHGNMDSIGSDQKANEIYYMLVGGGLNNIHGDISIGPGWAGRAPTSFVPGTTTFGQGPTLPGAAPMEAGPTFVSYVEDAASAGGRDQQLVRVTIHGASLGIGASKDAPVRVTKVDPAKAEPEVVQKVETGMLIAEVQGQNVLGLARQAIVEKIKAQRPVEIAFAPFLGDLDEKVREKVRAQRPAAAAEEKRRDPFTRDSWEWVHMVGMGPLYTFQEFQQNYGDQAAAVWEQAGRLG